MNLACQERVPMLVSVVELNWERSLVALMIEVGLAYRERVLVLGLEVLA